MERSLRSAGWRRLLAGLLVAAVMALGGSAAVSGVGQGHPVHLATATPVEVTHTAGIRWS